MFLNSVGKKVGEGEKILYEMLSENELTLELLASILILTEVMCSFL